MTLTNRLARLQLSFVVIIFSTGCAHTHRNSDAAISLSNLAAGQAPQTFVHVSKDVKKHFRYDNKTKPTWPPRVDIFGKAIGNCMTYSRIIHDRLTSLGYSVRYRNVLAPVAPREHVVAVATDHNGEDWVFDNRYPEPYSASKLSQYYEAESYSQSARVGAQRHQWVAVNRTLAVH